MNKFSKLILIMVLFSLSGFFTACGSKEKQDEIKKEKIKIVATAYPVYEWVKTITGDRADVELLINSGADLHSWNPSAKDIIKVTGKETDLFVYIGGESDFWVEKLIPQMKANGVEYFSIMKENAELLEPMGEHDHDHDHGIDEEHAEHDGEALDFDPDEYDEHIWLSVKRVPFFVNSIAEKIAEVDEANAEYYLANAENYETEINSLYKTYVEKIENSSCKTIVIADRNPFVYLACDLGLEVYAAFHGCSADTEASFDVMIGLEKIVEEKNLSSIVCCDVKNRIAETIDANVKTRDLNIVVLDSMQAKIAAGQSYDSIMTDNLEKLISILSEE